jgi:hypothetical protein
MGAPTKSAPQRWSVVVTVALAALAASCAQRDADVTASGTDRVAGAQQALAAMPDVDVVAVDTTRELVTIRRRGSGELSVIDLKTQQPLQSLQPAAAVAAATAPAVSEPAAPRTASAAASETAADADSAVAATGSESAEPTLVNPAIQRDPSGRVARIEGPGFSLQRVGSGSALRTRTGDPIRLASRADSAVSDGKGDLNARRRLNAVVCGAGDRIEINGAEIQSTAAGVVASQGCELTLSNSRVLAGGWGLVVNPGARVRLDNSVIEGRTGALDLYPGANLAAWASTFRGAIGRPLTIPDFRDLGGNTFEAMP